MLNSMGDSHDDFLENGERRSDDDRRAYRVPHPGLDLSYSMEDYAEEDYGEDDDDDDDDDDGGEDCQGEQDGDESSAGEGGSTRAAAAVNLESTAGDSVVSELGNSNVEGVPPVATTAVRQRKDGQKRRSVVTFATVSQTLGGDTSSHGGSGGESPPCYAIAMPTKVETGDDEKVGMDGISFSTVSCDDADFANRPAAASAAVDAVPSAFAGRVADNSASLGPSFPYRPLGLKRRANQDAARQDGTVTPTASMTGMSPSRRTTLSNSDKDHRSSAVSPRTHKAILRTKAAFFLFLLLVALSAAYLLFSNLRTTETQFAESQFRSIAQRAVRDSADVVSRKRLSMATMASVIGEAFREADDWPNVAVGGYDRIVSLLARTGSHTNMGFAPIVNVNEQSSFEDFAYDYFASQPHFPNTTGINSPDWRGVWRFQKGVRIHDSDASTAKRQILTPILQCCIDNPGDRVLLFNLHSEPSRRKTIDGIMNCTERIRADVERAELAAPNNVFADTSLRSTVAVAAAAPSHPDYSCGSMTEFVKIVRFKTRGPASIMFQPVFPAGTPWEARGLVLSPMAWDEVFEAVFASNMNGVHAVLEGGAGVWTYVIEGGKVESFQEGDIHQSKFDDFRVSTNLTWNDLHEMGAPMYKLSLYPTDEFVKSYSTSNPTNATIAAISIIVLISGLFLLYDYFVRREFLERHQLLEAKRRFIRFVSHEVRTPLNAVLMGLSIIEADMEIDDRHQEHGDPEVGDGRFADRLLLLREIQNNTESAVEVLNDVLLYDKIETCLKLEVSMVHIWNVVERTLSEFRLPAQRRGVHLRATYETSTTDGDCAYDVGLRVKNASALPDDVRCLCVAGDASRITQVLRNLLSNALKFTSKQGSILVTASYHMKSMVDERRVKWKGSATWLEKIELHNGQEVAATPRGHFQLTVQDNGVGMTPDQIGKLFGEGVQFNAHALQAGKGSGLGLFIAKGLVKQHKGTLEAMSEGHDKGAVFTLKLPLYHVPGLPSEEEEREGSTNTPDKKISNDELSSCSESQRLRILVVDDHPSNRKLLCRLLESKGHNCDAAENGQVALEMVRDTMCGNANGGGGAEPYDSILMDYEMPVMNGPTASSLIRELGCDVFIVGITGNILSDDVQYFKSRGANAILPKPFQLSALEDLFMEYHLTY